MLDIINFLKTEYKPAPGEFLPIDRQKLVEKFDLRAKGSERGKQGLPTTTSEIFDEYEYEITEALRTHALSEEKRTHEQLTLYEQRLQSADPRGAAADMRASAIESVTSFEAEALAARSELERAQEDLRERRLAFDQFRRDNKLERPVTHSPNHFWAFGALAIMFLLETAPNALLISSGSDLGVIGGYSVAIIFSGLNLFLGFAAGRWGFPNTHHVKSWRKAFGSILVATAIVGVVFLNVAVALAREHINAGMELLPALQMAWTDTIALKIAFGDMLSAAMAFVGMIFAFFAALAGYKWCDPYPGYTAVSEQRDKAENNWATLVEQRLSLIERVHRQFADALRADRASLRDRRASIPEILAQRLRLVRNFGYHIQHLEGVGRFALAAYRDANRSARSPNTPPPSRFEDLWSLTGIAIDEPTTVPAGTDDDWRAADEALENSMAKLGSAYRSVIDSIAQLRNDNTAIPSAPAPGTDTPIITRGPVPDGRAI